jgi:OOP family OmpA-OmpF porin
MIKHIIATAALAGIAAMANAQQLAAAPFSAPGGFYVGADAGSTKLTGAADGNRTSYGAFAGYTLNPNFAVEAGFGRLYDWSGYGASERGNQASLSLLGSVPLAGNLSLYGRLGVNQISMRGEIPTTNGGKYVFKDDTTRALLGVGLNYKLTEKVSARVEVQRPGLDLTNYKAGVSYAF